MQYCKLCRGTTILMNARIQLAVSFNHKTTIAPKGFGFCIYGDVVLPREVRVGEFIHSIQYKFTIKEVSGLNVNGGYFYVLVVLEPLEVETDQQWLTLKENLLNLFGISKYTLGLSQEYFNWDISYPLPKSQ